MSTMTTIVTKPAARRNARDNKIQTLNITEGAGGVRIDRDKYDAMKAALLRVIPRRVGGVAFKCIDHDLI